MKNVRLIRHGESAANAGEPTRDHASIPLTAKGPYRRSVDHQRPRPHSGLTVPSRPSNRTGYHGTLSWCCFRNLADSRIHLPCASTLCRYDARTAAGLGRG